MRQLLHSIQAGLDEGYVSGGVGHPGFQQPLAHQGFGVVQQPQQGSLLAAIITVSQHLQLPAPLQPLTNSQPLLGFLQHLRGIHQHVVCCQM